MSLSFRTFLPALLALFASTALAAPSALANDEAPKRTISLAATGSVKTAPDKVDISTGVTSEANSAREALDKNTAAMAKVVEALKAEGVNPKDIQTANFAVGPVYQTNNDGKPPVIIGYRVTNQVRISLHDIGKLGTILDKVVSLGANQIDSIEFGVSEPEALKDEARRLAFKTAADNARLYAETAGVALGPIISISEEEEAYQPRFAAAPTRMEMSKAVPIEAGTTIVEMRVRVTWEIK
jgi:uncharacterized protein YggE